VVVLSDTAPVLSVVVEVQRGRDLDKRWSWPVYLTSLRARMRCPAVLLVICNEPGIATWCERPIDLGHPGWVLRPLVVGSDAVPAITDDKQAADAPELAVLSAMAHGSEPGRTDILDTLHNGAFSAIDDERTRLYADIVLAVLSASARHHLEALMTTGTYKYQSDFARKYFDQGKAEGEAEGKAEGKAEAVLTVIRARGLTVTDDACQRISACTDSEQLDTWIRLAATVDSIDALFD
jgi:hypothetical protein